MNLITTNSGRAIIKINGCAALKFNVTGGKGSTVPDDKSVNRYTCRVIDLDNSAYIITIHDSRITVRISIIPIAGGIASFEGDGLRNSKDFRISPLSDPDFIVGSRLT